MMHLFAGDVVRHARSLLGCTADAEDVAQEVFIRAFRYRHTLKSDHLRTWLGTITHRQCLDHLERKAREPLLPAGGAEPGALEQSTPVSPTETADEANPFPLACLTPVEREVLALRFVERLSYREIAEVTGMAEGSLRNVQARALRRLREEYAK